MTITSTVVNGEIRLDEPTNLPEGARVTVVVADNEDFGPTPVPAETNDEFLEKLRLSLEEQKNGMRGLTLYEAFSIVESDIRNLH